MGRTWLLACLMATSMASRGQGARESCHVMGNLGFVPPSFAPSHSTAPTSRWHAAHTRQAARGRGDSFMIFDFIKKRSEEGLAQVQNIAKKTAEGKFSEALSDTASYVKERQKIDAENLAKLQEGLAKSRARLMADLDGFFGKQDEGLEKALETVLDQLEEALMMADIGAATTGEILDDVRAIAKEDQLDPDDVKSVLRGRLIDALSVQGRGMNLAQQKAAEGEEDEEAQKYPRVLFVIGANGMGKTTTIGKIAARLKSEANQTVLVAACDTFRAAAVDQLEEWTKRSGVDIHRPAEGQTKPMPVLDDAITRAIDGKYDVLIVDTSGRLSNNVALNEELKKLKNIITTRVPGGPHETLLVLDGAVGRNGVDQAKVWNREVGISGLAITKLDGTARGGVVVSIVRDLGVPVKLIGVGEGINDLRDFDPATFVDALLGYEAEQAAALEDRLQGLIKDQFIKPRAGVIVNKPKNSSGSSDAEDIAQRMQRRVQGGRAPPKRGGGKKKKR